MLAEFAHSVHSQNGEDGIIDHIFSVIGKDSRLFVEFGFGVPECNCLRLVEEGWHGLFIDSDSDKCLAMRNMIAEMNRGGGFTVNKLLTVDNTEGALIGMPDEIDLLSIDVDGNDYWLWKAIERIRPRVVVIEFNRALGPEVSATIPYDAGFTWAHDNYYGASLRALEKLGKEKGYKLIGCEPKGVNAFFLRDDIYDFEAVDLVDVLDWASIPNSWDKEREWVEV